MKKTFACAVRPNKAPSMRRRLSIISLEHSYRLYGSCIFDRAQLAPKCTKRGGELEAGLTGEEVGKRDFSGTPGPACRYPGSSPPARFLLLDPARFQVTWAPFLP